MLTYAAGLIKSVYLICPSAASIMLRAVLTILTIAAAVQLQARARLELRSSRRACTPRACRRARSRRAAGARLLEGAEEGAQQGPQQGAELSTLLRALGVQQASVQASTL
jgi:hypothetical protein